MPRFQRLTLEEARTLSRTELLPRIEQEQRYWYQLMNRGQMRVGDDAAFKTFNEIMHVTLNPGRSWPGTPEFWTKPLGELGDL